MKTIKKSRAEGRQPFAASDKQCNQWILTTGGNTPIRSTADICPLSRICEVLQVSTLQVCPYTPRCSYARVWMLGYSVDFLGCIINKKARSYAGLGALLDGSGVQCGGERGIRTLDTLLTYTHFPGVLLKPLGHLSTNVEYNGRGAVCQPQAAKP
jgi:hypothetical protein